MAGTTKYESRVIPKISLANFEDRIDEVTKQLCKASEEVGFFSVVDHGIPLADIERMFDTSASFFAMPDEVKATMPFTSQNVGWEKMAQKRPSTNFAPDTKESYQLQFGENMVGMWPSKEDLPSFQDKSLQFMHQVQGVSEKLMRCFARGLGFDEYFFVKMHDATRPDAQSTMRLLHYFELPETNDGIIRHRAGAHADWGFLTLLFQKEGQSGLEISPGRQAVTDFALGDTWTKVELGAGDIICNIGDLLMSWSDDLFKSTFHRVKAPCEPGDYYGERYSIAFFNQPRKDTIIQGPKKKYEAVTGAEFTAKAMKLYYKAPPVQASKPVEALPLTAQASA